MRTTKQQLQAGVGPLALTTLLLASTSAYAQPSGSTTLEEIVVTAQRRGENLQDVPIAVTALTGETLEAAAVDTTRQLQQVTPGLVTYEVGGQFLPFIRGVGSLLSQAGADSAVAVYVDGVYQANKASNFFDLNNLERIEVLKGPQGTLFGRNATGGAINIVTRDPEPVFTVDADASYGTDNDIQLRAYVAGPILNDALTASIAYSSRKYDGYIRDIARNTNDVGVRDDKIVMAKVRWAPTDFFTGTVSAFYNDKQNNSISGFHVHPGTRSAAEGLGVEVTKKSFETALSSRPFLDAQTAGATANLKIVLPGVDIISITGYRNALTQSWSDSDISAANFGGYATASFVGRQASQEIQFASNTPGPLEWIGGLYYIWDRQGYGDEMKGLNVVAGAPYPLQPSDLMPVGAGRVTNFDTKIVTRAMAAYAQATYEITPQDRLTLGARYSQEEKNARGSRASITSNADGTAFVRTIAVSGDRTRQWSRPTWRVAYDHKFNDDIMVYVSYNTGFKSGAYNTSAISPTAVPVQPEVLKATEVGMKSQWFDDRVRLNLAAFHYDYSNLQVSVIAGNTGLTDTQNAGSAELKGVDVDFVARITSQFTLRGGLNLLDTSYTDFRAASLLLPKTTTFATCPAVNPATGQGIPFADALARASGTPADVGGNYTCGVDVTGQDLVFAPKYSGNIAATYKMPLPGDQRLVFDTALYITDDYNVQPGGIFTHIDAWEALSASAAWYAPGDRYYVKVWGENLTDNVHPLIIQPIALGYGVSDARPLSYGITLGVSW